MAIAKATERSKLAVAAVNPAVTVEAKTGDAWNGARNAAEPASVRLFRISLLKCTCIAQLFDPWYMDENTRDDNAPEPNMQRGQSTSNERLHAHHLHITVHEPKIL